MNRQSAEKLFINGPAGKLEALLEQPEAPSRNIVAVICHPHPLHQGTMNNKVVTTLVRACQKLGAVAIRFNFRGVGESEGEYGETIGEADDLRVVVAWAQAKYPDHTLWLAGFSFGSFVSIKVASELKLAQLISIAPPVVDFDFTSVQPIDFPWLVVQGDKDEVVDPNAVFTWLDSLANPPHIIRMKGVGHFFHGKLVELREAIVEHLETGGQA